ncbi:MAG: RAMP superfamily CRISPR-associated protein [bacterium]
MPETTFINPYNFVPVSGTVDRENVEKLHGRFHGYSGKMTIRLETLSRLFIPDRSPGSIEVDDETGHVTYGKFQENKRRQKIIPGSSLKGMLRSVAEAISNSCFALHQDLYDKKIQVDFKELSNQRCSLASEAAGLCPCCRIFGHAAGDGEGSGDTSLQGRLTICDAVLDQASESKMDPSRLKLDPMQTAHVKHTPFYFEDFHQDKPSKIRGRKFYCHFYPTVEQRQRKIQSNKHNVTVIESFREQAVFYFDLHFENLAPDEMALLLHAIRLNNDFPRAQSGFNAHKIGLAKPLGFGSVFLSIVKMSVWKNAAAYTQFEPVAETTGEGPIEDKVQSLLEGQQNPFYNVGRKFSIWEFPRVPQDSNLNVRYPNRAWFRDERNASDNRYPLMPHGELPEPWESPDRDDTTPAKTGLSYQQLIDRCTRVKVLERKGTDVFVEVDGETKKVFCHKRTIDKGDEILVFRHESGEYRYQEERT